MDARFRQPVEVEVLEVVDAAADDQVDVAVGEGFGYALGEVVGLQPPGVRTDHRDLALREVVAHLRADPGLARAVLGVVGRDLLRRLVARMVVLPQAVPAGAEHDDVALAGIVDALAFERRVVVVERDRVSLLEHVDALERRHVDQQAAGEERADLLGPHLLEAAGAGDVGELRAVVEIVVVGPPLDAADLDHRMAETVELRADLADLRRDQLVHEGLREVLAGPAQRAVRRVAGDAERERPPRHQRHVVGIGHAECDDLALLDELRGGHPFLGRDVVGAARLVVGAELARPPALVDRVVACLCAERRGTREQRRRQHRKMLSFH